MDVPDGIYMRNRDWDPAYLLQIFSQDFHEFQDLWSTNVPDKDLVKEVEKVEKYCPIVEDISMDDESLCVAVERIEEE